VTLGNFLIKRVADRLRSQFPKLKQFCTLSPIPSFAGWLGKLERLESERVKPAVLRELQAGLDGLRERHGKDFTALAALNEEVDPGTPEGKQLEADRQMLRRLCAFHLLSTVSSHGHGSDPVARFHLNNGARLERINPAADLSRKGMRQSLGLMVNYLYDLDRIEANHERFVAGEVAASRAVSSLL
jgi:malonyl-CoA decarboxylase